MTNIIIDCGGKCGNCCNEVELVSTHKLEDGTVRRFYSDGTSDIYNPGVPLENPTTGGGSGATYDDTAIKERLTKLEDKQDKDTTYTAGKNIAINNNVISVETTYPDAMVNGEYMNSMSSATSPYGSSSTGIGDVAIFNVVGYMNEGDVIELTNSVYDGKLVWDIESQGTNEIYINGVLFKSELTDNGVKLTVLDRGAYKADTLINLSLMMRVQ